MNGKNCRISFPELQCIGWSQEWSELLIGIITRSVIKSKLEFHLPWLISSQSSRSSSSQRLRHEIENSLMWSLEELLTSGEKLFAMWHSRFKHSKWGLQEHTHNLWNKDTSWDWSQF
jgi:hypothetical protein